MAAKKTAETGYVTATKPAETGVGPAMARWQV
jgi:hypothetical protein